MVVYRPVIFGPGPLGIGLVERPDAERSGFKVAVQRFNRDDAGAVGAAERSGQVFLEDVLVSIGGHALKWVSYDDATGILSRAPRPTEIVFAVPHDLCAATGSTGDSSFVDYQRDMDEPLLMSEANSLLLSDRKEVARDARTSQDGEPPDGAFRQERAYVCPLIALANIGVFVWSIKLNGWKLEPLDRNPMLGPSVLVLYDMGAKDSAKIVNGEEWRLFVAMWLHAGLFHLLANLHGLAVAGWSGEKAHGWWRIALIYLCSGLAGNVASAIFLPANITVGASGAVFGLFGALWGDFLQNHALYKGKRCRQIIALFFMSLINIGLGAVIPMIDNFAHLGGFISGLLLSMCLFARGRRKRGGRLKTSQKCMVAISALAMLVCAVGGTTVLFTVVSPSSEWCGWCQLVTCAPLQRVPGFEWCALTVLFVCVSLGISGK